MTLGSKLPHQNERRYNFDLNGPGAADIVLPGVHSDLGGGYLPKAIEGVFLSKSRRSEVDEQVPFTEANSYKLAQNDLRRLQRQLAHYDLALEIRAWEVPFTFTEDRKRREMKNVYAAVSSQREVHGDLSFIYFRTLPDVRPRNSVATSGRVFGPIAGKPDCCG